jgi:hypothetical protein
VAVYPVYGVSPAAEAPVLKPLPTGSNAASQEDLPIPARVTLWQEQLRDTIDPSGSFDQRERHGSGLGIVEQRIRVAASIPPIAERKGERRAHFCLLLYNKRLRI